MEVCRSVMPVCDVVALRGTEGYIKTIEF